MSKVPELDLHDDDVLELEDIVETPQADDDGDDLMASTSDLDLSFEQELEDLFSDTPDENSTQTPPAFANTADTDDDLDGLDLESGETIDLAGFELDDAGSGQAEPDDEDDILDLVEPLETADFTGADDDLAATTVLSARDQHQDLDDLDALDDFGPDSDETDTDTGDDLAATTVMSVMPGENERVADVGGFELEAEDELTLDLGEDDDNEDQADAFVEDEDFDISGLDELLGADEAAADDVGPMASTADIDAAELGLEDIDLETTAVQGNAAEPEPEFEDMEDTGDLDVLGLEDLISDLELPDQETEAESETADAFDLADFVDVGEDMGFEDITDSPEAAEPASTGAADTNGLIDLGLEDIVEAGGDAADDQAVEEQPVAEATTMDFGDDLVDLSDTFDESLGGLEGLEGLVDMEEPSEAAAGAGWDIELPAADLEVADESEEDVVEDAAVQEAMVKEAAAEANALEEEWAFEEEEPVQAKAENDFDFEPAAAAPDLEELADEEFAFDEPVAEEELVTEPEPAPVVPEPEQTPAPESVSAAAVAAPSPPMDQEAVEQLVSTLEAMDARIQSLESAAAERERLQERVATLENELAQVAQSAGALEQSVHDAMEKLDTSLGDNGAVAAMITQRLDAFRQSLDSEEPAKDEELNSRVQQLEASVEQAGAQQAQKLEEVEQKLERLNELDALAEKVALIPSQDDLQALAREEAQDSANEAAQKAADTAADQKVQQALAEDGAVSRKLEAALGQAIADLRDELSGQIESVKKTADEIVAAQAEEGDKSEELRESLRKEIGTVLAENGQAARTLRETVERVVTGLRQELFDKVESVKKTVEETAAAQADDDEKIEALRASLREELDNILAENGNAAAAVQEAVDTAVSGLREELSGKIQAATETAEQAAAQAGDDEKIEALRASLREELDNILAENGNAAAAVQEAVDTAVSGLREELSGKIQAAKETAEQAAAQADKGDTAEAVRQSIKEELVAALGEGGAIASKIEEKIGAVEESARLDNMALESRLGNVIDQFGDPETVPEPVINAISSGIVEAMDEGGPFHTRMEERLTQVAKERQGDLESFANKLDEVLQTFREEGISRGDVDAIVGERLAGVEESLRANMLTAEDVAGIVDERTTPAMEKIRGELSGELFEEVKDKVAEYVEQGVAAERERMNALLRELGEEIRPSTEDLRAAAMSTMEETLPQFRASLVEELDTRIGSHPLGQEAQNAIADAVETRMRDSLAEDSDIYENLVGNLTEQLERVIREGVESLERKTVSHEDWNVLAARLRQELSAKVEQEAAKSAARIIREEITTLLGED
eukprot:TRINITY_DN2172_c0_g1_i3.p1 TRINITY_DN2172_c0_g1~~TRINITY_DN2172_c0_g1_i3.p1  ORF type:complete len:1320 (-),score=486.70 TRINITY_DN2172_c0_g1_i3:36912-40871(-)